MSVVQMQVGVRDRATDVVAPCGLPAVSCDPTEKSLVRRYHEIGCKTNGGNYGLARS